MKEKYEEPESQRSQGLHPDFFSSALAANKPVSTKADFDGVLGKANRSGNFGELNNIVLKDKKNGKQFAVLGASLKGYGIDELKKLYTGTAIAQGSVGMGPVKAIEMTQEEPPYIKLLPPLRGRMNTMARYFLFDEMLWSTSTAYYISKRQSDLQLADGFEMSAAHIDFQ